MSDNARVQAPLQFWRSGVITACGLGLAAAAHIAGGGNLPPVQVMLLLAVLSLCPVTLLARRRLRLPAMAGILGAGQAALHAAFTALSGPSAHCTGAAVSAHGHHTAAAVPDCAAAVGNTAVGHAASATAEAVAGLPAPVMLMAHLLAIAVTAVLLARGEAALWQVRAWLAPLAAVVHPVVLPPAVRAAALRSEAVTPRFTAVRIPPRRGPPALFGRAVPAFRMPASCLPA